MAHEIENNMMFSVRQTPWHRQGTVLNNPPTTEEAIKHARLDWIVYKEPLYLVSTPGEGKRPDFTPTEFYAMVRYDETGTPVPLGQVSDRYTPVQNVRAFSVFDRLMKDNGYTYETAGATRNGRKIWILAKAPANETVGGDRVDKYVLLVTSHDGSMNLRLLPTAVRVVCNNTMTIALERGSDEGFSIRHTGDIDMKLKMAEDALALADMSFAKARDIWNFMVDAPITQIEAMRYFEKVVPQLKKRHDDSKAWKRAFEVIGESFLYGRGNKGETLWHAYSALTEWVDHLKGVDQSRIVDYATFGEGARIKRDALSVASEIIAERIFEPASSPFIGVN